MFSLLSGLFEKVDQQIGSFRNWMDNTAGEKVRKTIVWILVVASLVLGGDKLMNAVDKANQDVTPVVQPEK